MRLGQKISLVALLSLVTFACLLGWFSPVSHEPTVNQPTKLERMVANNLPTVVHVQCSAGWQGSGVIISNDGMVLTASHVIGEGGNTFNITMNDGRKFTTQKSCVVRNYDAGFLKIDTDYNLPHIMNIADANNLRLGCTLFAIGSQFGYGGFNSVTAGILSAHKRTILDKRFPGWSILFQSDVGANPGSSGGPIFNIDGGLVGVVVGGMNAAGNITYCVPSNIIFKYIDAARAMFIMQDIKDTMEGGIPDNEVWIKLIVDSEEDLEEIRDNINQD